MKALEILQRLCHQPTVSYHEHHVAKAIVEIARDADLAVQPDEWGSLHVHSPRLDLSGRVHPAIALVAHMDHPGFEAVGTNQDGSITAVSHGGMPPASFESGTEVQIIQQNGTERIRGSVLRSEGLRVSHDGRFARAEAVVLSSERRIDELPAAVILDLPDFELDGEMIRARSLDDLAGCATILASLIANQDSAASAVGVFTRAEEVGLVGARLIAEKGLLPRDCKVVSVETSLKSESAPQGGGVVIRVGDRMTTFDHEAESVLRAPVGIKTQRALMGAGGCEASAFKAHGYKVTGTSYPLGAWHNREEDGSISAEYISRSDFEAGVGLFTEVIARYRVPFREQTDTAMRDSLAEHPLEEAERLRKSSSLYAM